MANMAQAIRMALHYAEENLGVTDIYVIPYPNPAQITSGTLAYAVGAGKAVVSTPFWHAEELLQEGRGRLYPFNDSDKLAENVIDLLDDTGWNNQAVPFTRSVINMIEQAKAIVGGAIVRDESRGAHFKVDTPERDDANWLKTTMASWTPQGPTFDFEPIDVRYLAPRARKYAVNQITIATKLMGPDFREKFGGSTTTV